MKYPPCKRDGVDCEKRVPGCHDKCGEYQEWKRYHDADLEGRRSPRNQADVFLIEQQMKVKKRRGKDEYRGYKRK